MSNARNFAYAALSAPGGLAPTGVVLPFAGTSAPTGWLLCQGQAVSRTTYSALFAVISTTYGAGNGTTTFNLPDLGGRVPAGKEPSSSRLTTAVSGVEGSVLGSTGGFQSHTLDTTQIPSHNHGVTTVDASPGGGPYLYRASSGGQTVQYSTSTGGGGAHNNTQPTIVLNYIIKI